MGVHNSLSFNFQTLRLIKTAPVTLLLLTFAIVLLLPNNSVAAQDKTAVPTQAPALIDKTQRQASTMVLNAAKWLDNFFNDSRATSEANKTMLRVSLGFGYSKNDSVETRANISGRIDLPHLSKKLNLIISTYKDEDLISGQDPISSSLDKEDSKKRRITTALQYFITEGKINNISTSVGASSHYLYTEIRYRHLDEFDSWQGRLIDKIRYLTDDGLENIISYDLEHYFSNRWLFRTTVEADWYRRKSGLPHSLNFGCYQIISSEKAILYEMGNYFTTEDSYRMTDLQLRLRYRQRFLRNWLILEISPQVTFPEDHDRRANPGIIVKLEADLGNLSGRKVNSEILSF